jgi:protein TonB
MRKTALLGWPVIGSVAVHAGGLAAVALLVAPTPAPPAATPVAIEVVRLDAPAPPPPPPPPPPPKRVEKLVPPRLMVPPHEVAASNPAVLDAKDAEPVAPPSAPVPLAEERPMRQSPMAGMAVGAPDARLFGGTSAFGPSVPALAGASRLFARGDVLLPGGGAAADSAAQSAQPRVAAIPQESADGGGLTGFARPLGGYQTKPSYPESARRQGIEGVTTLRFQVLTDGHVGRVAVAHSAGHAALDRAAMEAVRTWLFEPARRGKDAVAVWVTLPVRFRLQSD